jgi:hypothetical protein
VAELSAGLTFAVNKAVLGTIQGWYAAVFTNPADFTREIGWGGTLATFMLATEHLVPGHGLDPSDFRMFSFDSFEGYRRITIHPVRDARQPHPTFDLFTRWLPGRYALFVENCVLLANLLSMVEDSVCKSDEPT